MSQPRRKRRRRRKPSGETAQKPRQEGAQVREQASDLDRTGSSRSRNRRRRRRGGGAGPGGSSPKSSEDLVRAAPKERPTQLTAPPDGQSLEQIIGELQSNYGVPAYPQEYRITIKVAEEKSSGGGQGGGQGAAPKAPATPAPDGAPKREKAPAPPRVGPDGSEESATGERPAKRRRSRRRRGRGRSGGPPGSDESGGSSSPPDAPPPPPPA